MILAHDLDEERGVRQMIVFNYLENNALNREPIFLSSRKGRADAIFRPIHGIGHKIYIEVRVHAKARSEGNRSNPTILIETVAVLVVDLIEHPESRLSIGSPDECFIRIHRFQSDVDNRLEC